MEGKFREGVFKKELGGNTVQWHQVSKTRYPTEKWWVTTLEGEAPHIRPKMDTRRELTDAEWAELHEWL